ncbi:M20 metallopeptidase family protein [Shimazuella kribbensis]|uniref:M20 metallopeptidase family protein n=1 Tax=Shimazuella kribbensis TaxID=139808 RepID=UPI00041BDFBA|nr:amidohydrolase [Shimazuella kribbensis]
MEVSSTLAEWAIAHRRHIHQFPELSGQEWETHQYIKKHIQDLGLEILDYQAPSLVAFLPGTDGTKTIGLRSDIDALPIQEEGEKTCISQRSGVAHVCGHDGHTAILLSVAKWASENRYRIKPNLVFVFQSAEEMGPSGAEALIEQGLLELLDEIYGLHLWQPLKKGKIGLLSGSMMASSDEFELVIHGSGGHGALPHETIDPIFVASQVISGIQSIISRKINPMEPAVITVGKVVAGTTYNIIPHEATLYGTLRAFTNEVREWLPIELERVAKGIAEAYGASISFKLLRGTPPVINDSNVSEFVKQVIVTSFPAKTYETIEPSMAAEDFSFYLQKKPGAFLFVGMNSEKSSYPHHDPRFDIDEESISMAIRFFCELILHQE